MLNIKHILNIIMVHLHNLISIDFLYIIHNPLSLKSIYENYSIFIYMLNPHPQTN